MTSFQRMLHILTLLYCDVINGIDVSLNDPKNMSLTRATATSLLKPRKGMIRYPQVFPPVVFMQMVLERTDCF